MKALSWGMDNSADYAKAYRGLIHEGAIKIGLFTKVADFSFSIAAVTI